MAKTKKKSRAKPKAAPPVPLTLKRVQKVFDKHKRNLRRRQGVLHVSYGAKHQGGSYHFQREKPEPDVLAIIVYVEKKIKNENDLPPRQMIPKFLDGVPTDVVEVATAELTQGASRLDPLVGGARMARQANPAAFGSMGLVVEDNQTGDHRILTCAHLAFGGLDPATPPGPITQPNSAVPGDVIGMAQRNGMVPVAGKPTVDAATILPNGSRRLAAGKIHNQPGQVGDQADAPLLHLVAKQGSVTERTVGKVVDTNAPLQVGSHSFFGLLKIAGRDGLFVDDGDSGAAVFLEPPDPDPDGPIMTIVGLVIAKDTNGGSNANAYAEPIRRVFDVLDVDLTI
jgi:hypothetical protein